MPEFVLDHGTPEASKAFREFDSFTQGYVEAMFFTSTGTSDDGDLQNASVAELAPAAWGEINSACVTFQVANETVLARAYVLGEVQDCYDATRAGRDFWYTRNGHGCGYWDRGLGEVGGLLSDAAYAYGESDLYRGDDGLLYLS